MAKAKQDDAFPVTNNPIDVAIRHVRAFQKGQASLADVAASLDGLPPKSLLAVSIATRVGVSSLEALAAS